MEERVCSTSAIMRAVPMLSMAVPFMVPPILEVSIMRIDRVIVSEVLTITMLAGARLGMRIDLRLIWDGS